MTGAEIIAAVRNEIEREAKSIDTATGDFAEGRRMEQRIILSVLSDLEKEEKPNSQWSEEDERILKGIIGLIDHDQHYGVSNNEMLTWFKSLRPQPKQEWSEDDKEKLYQVIETLLADKEVAIREYPLCKPLHEAYDDMITFLKSLHPQPHWKPSEEQMRALGDYIDGEEISSYDIEEIVSLYNNLRNL